MKGSEIKIGRDYRIKKGRFGYGSNRVRADRIQGKMLYCTRFSGFNGQYSYETSVPLNQVECPFDEYHARLKEKHEAEERQSQVRDGELIRSFGICMHSINETDVVVDRNQLIELLEQVAKVQRHVSALSGDGERV